MASNKSFMLIIGLLVVLFMFTSEVLGRDVAKTSNVPDKVKDVHAGINGDIGGGYPGGGGGGYPGGGYPGHGGGGYCRFGCCGRRGYGGYCMRCCGLAEAAEYHVEAEPHN